MKERSAQIGFQRAYLPADRGLAHVEVFTGMGKRAGLRRRLENAQLVPIHSVPPLSARRRASPPEKALFRRFRVLAAHRKIAFRLKRRHAAETGGGDGLAERLVG